MLPPYHETLPHVTKDNWREVAAQKKQSVNDAIPKDWLLPKGKYDDLLNVMHVPKECGILSDKEVEITEIDDVAEVSIFSHYIIDVNSPCLMLKHSLQNVSLSVNILRLKSLSHFQRGLLLPTS
jgi:hypothetical protein